MFNETYSKPNRKIIKSLTLTVHMKHCLTETAEQALVGTQQDL